MAYELARYLPESEKLMEINDRLKGSFSKRKHASGYHITRQIEALLPSSLLSPLLHILVDEGVINVTKPSSEIKSCYFSIDRKASDDFFISQAEAARIIREIEESERENASILEIVATMPPLKAVGSSIKGIRMIDDAIKKLISEARDNVWIINPFYDAFGASTLVSCLLGRAREGVRTRIIGRELMSSDNQVLDGWKRLEWILDQFRQLDLEHLLEIRDFSERDPDTGRFRYALHSKIVLSDQSACYIGSANINEPSLRSNFELGVVVRGSIVKSVNQLAEHIWENSKILFPHPDR